MIAYRQVELRKDREPVERLEVILLTPARCRCIDPVDGHGERVGAEVQRTQRLVEYEVQSCLGIEDGGTVVAAAIAGDDVRPARLWSPEKFRLTLTSARRVHGQRDGGQP